MANSKYSGHLILLGTDVVDLIDAIPVPSKLSELENDTKFITLNDKVDSCLIADTCSAISTNSGVIAGSYGATSNASLNNNTVTINIPQLTVNSKGLVTNATNRVLKITSY